MDNMQKITNPQKTHPTKKKTMKHANPVRPFAFKALTMEGRTQWRAWLALNPLMSISTLWLRSRQSSINSSAVDFSSPVRNVNPVICFLNADRSAMAPVSVSICLVQGWRINREPQFLNSSSLKRFMNWLSGNDRRYNPMAVGISLLRPSLIQMVVDSPGDMHFIQRCFRYSFRDFLKRIRTWDSNRVNRHLAVKNYNFLPALVVRRSVP